MLAITQKILCNKDILKKALSIALVVGTILNIINQGDYLFRMMFEELNFFKMALTYCVPFLVSAYTAASMKMKFHIGEKAIIGAALTCKRCGEQIMVNEDQIIPECSKCALQTHWKLINTQG